MDLGGGGDAGRGGLGTRTMGGRGGGLGLGTLLGPLNSSHSSRISSGAAVLLVKRAKVMKIVRMDFTISILRT